jgi:hypothetical protein
MQWRFAREKRKEESVRPVSRVKRTGTKLVRNVAARTQNANESLYGGSNAELRTEQREQLPDVIPPRKYERAYLCFPLSLSLCVSLCLFLSLTNARAQKKIEQEVERFLKSESATTSCSLVERIARTSGPAICRASNSNDYIYSRFKGTGLTLIGFERRPTKRSIREFFWPLESFLPLFHHISRSREAVFLLLCGNRKRYKHMEEDIKIKST